jgi:plasmid stability protein
VDFTIRNLPAPVLEDLQRAARLNGRSVNDEVIARLASASRSGSRAGPRSTRPGVADFRKLRSEHPLASLTLDELQRAIEEGRP